MNLFIHFKNIKKKFYHFFKLIYIVDLIERFLSWRNGHRTYALFFGKLEELFKPRFSRKTKSHELTLTLLKSMYSDVPKYIFI